MCTINALVMQMVQIVKTLEFGEIPNFSRQAKQAGKLTYLILYFHIKIQ